jgi:hypothetical protein
MSACEQRDVSAGAAKLKGQSSKLKGSTTLNAADPPVGVSHPDPLCDGPAPWD